MTESGLGEKSVTICEMRRDALYPREQ
jgi:hypothetical protein